MRTVPSNLFRDNLADYLDKVAKDETPLVVSRFGNPLVVVTPYKKGKVDNIDKYFGFLGKGKSGASFVKRVRRSGKEKRRTASLRSRND